MIPIPKMRDVDVAFGNINHLPRYEDVPESFKSDSNIYSIFVASWFFKGLTEADAERVTPRDGVDAQDAFRALSAIMVSFAPKHEHKQAGVAYLMSGWFELAPAKSEAA